MKIRNFLCSLDVTRNIIRHNSHWALLGSNNATESMWYIYYTQKLKSQKQDVSEWMLNKKTHFPFSQIFPFHAVQILNVKRPHFKRSILSVTHVYTIYR